MTGDVDRDRGTATTCAAAISLALLGLLGLGVHLGSATLTRHRAEGAADLAALAAAAHAAEGVEPACSRAEWVVRSMRGVVRSCRLEGWDARVEVRASPPAGPLVFLAANARARAGPVSPAEAASPTSGR